ncbi:MFS transporter [Tsukamurella sp. 8F]|uniref:MFS transporter n=1 Tax=unclassified Tsukamurella TaxID=2633480 RepID=UPI0023B8AB68|nr:MULTISPECIES: MFS transporter [unclassified Tsukamurella]MDF0529426.1 MFS transporter [Tsukamurella sp. 8J]MDF0587067.1 MFS transporter [Tsukamurella sp. 8F]
MTEQPVHPAPRAVLRHFRDVPNLLRLLGVRLLSQFTDGLFQAALGSAIIFNPERAATPAAIAAGLAVLLLPYSLIGPFAGALLDRWDRRLVFIGANLVRAVLIAVTAVVVATGASETGILVAALAVGGASRFVASGLSAALPHVVDRPQIVAMNSVTTTAGSAATACGAGAAVLLRLLFGAGDAGSGATLLAAVVSAVAGALLAARFKPRVLGPDHFERDGTVELPLEDPNHPGPAQAIATGLAHGAVAVWRAPPAAAALSGVGAHRLVFGLNTLMLLLLTRYHFADGSVGLAGFSAVAGATGVGMVLAAVVTPLSVAAIGRRSTLVVWLTVDIVAQLALLTVSFPVIVVAAGVLGLGGQVIKLSGDAAMQMDVPDERRGQVFSFQDALFNASFVAAVWVAAATVPFDGASKPLVWLGAALYAAAIAAVVLMYRRGTGPDADASNGYGE